MKEFIKNSLPVGLIDLVSEIRQKYRRAVITNPTGLLDPMKGKITFVMIVGQTFDQKLPNAMMTCRMGYCHGFEAIGIPYIIIDIHQVAEILPKLSNPVCMLYAADLAGVSDSLIRSLKKYTTGIWVQPWFKDSMNFFKKNGLDYKIWTFNDKLTKKILEVEANFGFTATTPSGLHFFNEWDKNGLKMASLPLACDTKMYNTKKQLFNKEFSNVDLAFVGGYWTSKGVQIDDYLRPWESKLIVYGYSKWPYSGYCGPISCEHELELLHQAKVCPVVNEPTVALMSGQINERVFKVLGSAGCPIVDAVPAYRELYSEDELLVANNTNDFNNLVQRLLDDKEFNNHYRKKGKEATLARHTYSHRAVEFLRLCGIENYSVNSININ